MVEVNIA